MSIKHLMLHTPNIMLQTRLLFLIAFLFLNPFHNGAQEVKILSWNIKWMGNPSNCSCDTSVQRQNVETILSTEDPDIILLQEVVSKKMLDDIARNLGYSYALAPYSSFASDTTSGSYESGQKLAVLYKNHTESLFSYGLSKSTYPFLSNSNSPYYFFASGRFPYLHQLKIEKDGAQDTLIIVNIHGKAGSGTNDYTRRQNGARVIIDSLQLQYPDQPIAVIGDFNDLMDGSISSASVSPYKSLIDSGYIPIFNQDSVPGGTTNINYANSIIDNFVLSPAAHVHLKPNSAEILSNVQQYIPNYGSTTSDHLPIVFSYYLTDSPAHVGILDHRKIQIFPNPTSNDLMISIDNPEGVTYFIRDISGRLWSKGTLEKQTSVIPLELTTGYYNIQFWHENAQKSFLIYRN